MNYLNPFDLLNIVADDLSVIDSSALRKAKKALLAEIELNDSKTITHNKNELTKSDCLRAIDELDDIDKKEFHFFIHQNKTLNNFLSNGDLSFFQNYKVESIYNLPEFLDFISPYFARQYDKLLATNYKKKNINTVKLLLSVNPIVKPDYLETCYKTTYLVIKQIDNEITKINKNIEAKSETFNDYYYEYIPKIVNEIVNTELINLLPSYFQSLRNQLAQTINGLSTTLNNKPISSYKCALQIIELAKSISTDGLASQKVTKAYFIIKGNSEDSLVNDIGIKDDSKNVAQNSDLAHEEEAQAQEDEEEEKIEANEEENKKPKDYVVSIIFISCLAVGFFYRPLQYFILSIQLIILFVALFYTLKKKKKEEISIRGLFKNSFIFIIGGIIGILYSFIARIFIVYYFLTFSEDLFVNKNKRDDFKNRWLVYLFSAVIISTIYHLNTVDKTIIQESRVVLTDNEYLQKGRDYFNNSKYTEAIIQFNEAISVNPNFADAYGDRGASKANLGKYDSAIFDYLKAEQLGLNSSILYSNFGFSYYKLKQIDSALKYLEKALNIDSENSRAYRWRGEIKYDNNDNIGAKEDYTLAIKYDPNSSNYFARGLAYYYLKDYKKAIQDMDKAIELDPNNGQYYYDRGDAKDLLNDFEGACSDWKMAKLKGYAVPGYKIIRCTPKIIYVTDGELIGCVGLSPKYNYTIDNELIITVGSNASVAVKLINYSTAKCIRYVFINKNSSYSIRHIPEGKYYLKIAYGNDWSIMDGQPRCSGRFSRNTLFEKGEDILDFNLKYSGDGYQVPSYSLKLDVIISEDNINSFNTDKINETEFYNE